MRATGQNGACGMDNAWVFAQEERQAGLLPHMATVPVSQAEWDWVARPNAAMAKAKLAVLDSI